MFEEINYSGQFAKVLNQFRIAENDYFKPAKKEVVETGDLMFVKEGVIYKVEVKINDNIAYVNFLEHNLSKKLKMDTIAIFLFRDNHGAVFFLLDGGIYVI